MSSGQGVLNEDCLNSFDISTILFSLSIWPDPGFDPVSDNLVNALCYTETMKFNLDTVREDTRRFGMILVAAGVLNTFFEDSDPLTSVITLLVGILVLVVGNLENE